MSSNDYEYLGLIGHSLSVPERSAVKMSLIVLGEKLQAKMALWGKILGIEGDYLIAQTVPENIVEPRLSFYSIDGGVNWVALAGSLTPDQEALCEQLRGRYFGRPEFEYKIRKDIPPEPQETTLVPPAGELAEKEEEDEEEAAEENNEEEEENNEEEVDEELMQRKKNRPKFQILKVTEAIRVAHFVGLHDTACRLVVRGQYILAEKTGKVVPNRTYVGLDVPHALKMRHYLRLSTFPKDEPRPPLAEETNPSTAEEAAKEEAAAEAPVLTADEKRVIIAENNKRWFGPGYNAATDFLAPITEDSPEGIWLLKYDPSLAVVAVQNMYYNGSLFWYCPDTTECGQLYCGTGERNLDLCFQLPGGI